jgi:hypothetical protein
VISTLFRAMNTKREDRAAAKLPAGPTTFPTSTAVVLRQHGRAAFSKIARSYLLHVGGLDWTKINPDIFGSMIQAVAEDEERGELGCTTPACPTS